MHFLLKVFLSVVVALLLSTNVVGQGVNPSSNATQPSSTGGNTTPSSTGVVSPSGTSLIPSASIPSNNSSTPTASQNSTQAEPTGGSVGLLVLTSPKILYQKTYLIAKDDNVQFNWTLNGVSVKPQIITFELQFPNSVKYHVANISGSDTGYLWKTSEWPQSSEPLVEANSYFMNIFDADYSISNSTGRMRPTRATFSIYIRGGFKAPSAASLNDATSSQPALSSLAIGLITSGIFMSLMKL